MQFGVRHGPSLKSKTIANMCGNRFHSFLGRSSTVLLYVHRDRTDYQGRGAQDGHLDFHTAPEI